jgi:hypothetical protein
VWGAGGAGPAQGLPARLHCGLRFGPCGRHGHRLRPGAVHLSRARARRSRWIGAAVSSWPFQSPHWYVMTGVGGPVLGSVCARRGSRSADRHLVRAGPDQRARPLAGSQGYGCVGHCAPCTASCQASLGPAGQKWNR